MRRLHILVTLTMLASLGCTKDADINLISQPLSVIQERLNGRWRVQYMQGGIAGMRIEGKNGQYFQFSATTIQSGDDNGEKLNSPITWKKVPWGNNGEETYVLNYGDLVYPNQLLVYKIENGVLQMETYGMSDGYVYYLVRW